MSKLLLAYFSPTRTTEMIVQAVGRGLASDTVEILDFTKPQQRGETPIAVEEDTVVIWGAPVYAGRAQTYAMNQLKRLAGKVPLICLAVYGNRHYDDALLEMYDWAVSNGFTVAGCGAFSVEHSLTHATGIPIAAGRPDDKDLRIAEDFGRELRAKIDGGFTDSIEPPGNRPYKPGITISTYSPLTLDSCIGCGSCIEACPTDSIRADFTCITESCIRCCACAKACPVNAKVIRREGTLKFCERLAANERREPELFY